MRLCAAQEARGTSLLLSLKIDRPIVKCFIFLPFFQEKGAEKPNKIERRSRDVVQG